MLNIGLEGTGCAIELKIVQQTDRAYPIRDDEGKEIWLPKLAFDDYGELNEYGMRLYEEK